MGSSPLAAPRKKDWMAMVHGMPTKRVATRMALRAPMAAARGADCLKAVRARRSSTTGMPAKSAEFEGLKKNEKGDYLEALGLNRDPHANFSVVTEDGKPALRISGEVFGGISTKEEFENYHFRAEFKWGQKKWPPREKTVRDNGLLYHCVGPQGAGSGAWLKSFEMQIQEHDCGDFHSVAGVLVDVEAVPKDPSKPKGDLLYRKGAEQ